MNERRYRNYNHVFSFTDIPIAVSLPHFYNSDPSLLNDVEGMAPDKEKHDSIILLQPVSHFTLKFS